MQCRNRSYQIGQIVKVKHCPGAYRLPDALPEGTRVKVLASDHGNVTVQIREGHVFEVNLTCIDNGMEFELNGRWLDENDPLILAARQREKARERALPKSCKGGM